MTDKKLEFKHAHITGQAMRDHWGPIVERIAAETADWRDEWIYDLITENERLKRSADYWEQDAKRYAANQEHWRMEERAKIVGYARGHGGNAWSRDVLYFADKIEAGEHLK